MQGCSTKYEGKASEGRRVNKQEEDLMVLHHMELAQEKGNVVWREKLPGTCDRLETTLLGNVCQNPAGVWQPKENGTQLPDHLFRWGELSGWKKIWVLPCLST